MAWRSSISFVRRGEIKTETQIAPHETLLDYLRLREGNISVKEGCCEGDCGACTIALGHVEDGRIVYSPVNSCIYPVGMIDGKEVVTASDLSPSPDERHPVQSAMISNHGSQCGFCTPGFVMSLYTLWSNAEKLTRDGVNDCISGNLCRCTGYRAIVDAACIAASKRDAAAQTELWPRTFENLNVLQRKNGKDDYSLGDDNSFFAAPATLDRALELYARHGDAVLVAGATDVGLWITKKLANLEKIIWLGRVKELLTVVKNSHELTIGGAVTYQRAAPYLTEIHADILRLLRRLGSRQVRASGTVGGNIANGSPIGDMPPILIALDAKITLASHSGSRIFPLQDFFIQYGEQDMAPNEILQSVTIPTLRDNELFSCGKISKRFDQDISSVMGAIKLSVDNGLIAGVRIAFGGMAETPKRACLTEQALIGLSLADTAAIDKAVELLSQDFAPISDMRASANYRQESAAGFLRRSLRELSGVPISESRVFEYEYGAR